MDIFTAVGQKTSFKNSTIDYPRMIPNFVLLEIEPCVVCSQNRWQHDDELWLRTKGRYNRFSCWPCGNDFYVGGIAPDMLREMYSNGKGE